MAVSDDLIRGNRKDGNTGEASEGELATMRSLDLVTLWLTYTYLLSASYVTGHFLVK